MITVTGISKSFGDIQAVEDLSFKVKSGEIVGLLGPNGAGKTTTMRVMSGFLAPDEGDVEVDEISVLSNPTEAQELIGYLPENNPLYEDMLVGDFLSLSAELKGISKSEKKEAFDFVVKAVNIQDVFYRPIGELSKGYKQRVGIAVALLHKPKVLIMDEPTEGLDPRQRAEIRELVKKLSKGHTIIISTHVLGEVEALCTRMVIIDEGKKVADGSVEELSARSKNEKIVFADIEGNDVKKELDKVKIVKDLKLEAKDNNLSKVRITSDAKDSIQPYISKLAKENDWVVWRLVEERLQLEDVFKQLTEK